LLELADATIACTTKNIEKNAMPLIPAKESLTCEFKSDRKCLSDKELLEALICLANTDGGELYLGVEDDGTVTGLHPNHRNLQGLSALIANRTVPSLSVTVVELKVNEQRIARLSVPQLPEPVATTDGTIKIRGASPRASLDFLVPRKRGISVSC
jgi:ATP-dependent DNA helicase RecG